MTQQTSYHELFGFLELLLSINVCMHVCVCVRPEAINN